MNVNIPIAQPVNPPFATWETEANQMGLQGEHRRLYKLLRDFHGFIRQQCVTLRDQGYMPLSDLVDCEYKDVRSLLENLSNRPTTRGGQQFGDRRIKQLQALAWFVTDRNSRGLTYHLDLYQSELNTYIKFAKIDSQIGKDGTGDKPEKFKYADWIKWEESVYIYLNSIITKAGVSLSYVIRKELDEDTVWENLDRKVQQIHTARLDGLIFNLDSERVMELLKELCLRTKLNPGSGTSSVEERRCKPFRGTTTASMKGKEGSRKLGPRFQVCFINMKPHSHSRSSQLHSMTRFRSWTSIVAYIDFLLEIRVVILTFRK